MRRTGWTLLALACLSQGALAIIPNNGLDSEFNFVGRTQGGGASLVAVGKRAVITAAHVNLPQFVTFGADGTGPLYEIDVNSKMDIGGSDIRLYRTKVDLPSWVGFDFTPLPVAFTHTEDTDGNLNFEQNGGALAEELRAVGYGFTGTVNGAGTGYQQTANSAGNRHAARFFSDSRGDLTVGTNGPFSSIVSFLINNGDGILEGGDSGGGLFRNVGGQWKLVGINSATGGNRMFGTNWTPDRLLGTGTTLSHISVFAELAPHRDQISAYLVPEPASMAALGLGALALIRRRRK